MFEYFDKPYAWNMAVTTLVDEVGTISEPDRALSKLIEVAGGDSAVANAAWIEAMTELGEAVEKYAEVDASRGNAFSAARKHHRAAMYFIRAERMASHTNPKRLEIYKRALKNYRSARVLGRDPIEFVQIPYKGAYLPALFLKGEGEGRRPTVIHLQGFDSIKETQYPYLGGYRPRRISALIVDQPGAGEAIRIHGLTGEVETENYVKVIIDYLESRPDVDGNRIGVAGISMGGYFAPRAACFENRIKAVCAWGAMYDFGALVRARFTDGKTSNASVPDVYGHGMWTWDVDSPEAWAELSDRITLRGVIDKLKCPLLVTHGENDRQVPLDQARRTVEEARSSDKELKIFTLDEGGAEHCQLDNRYLGSDFVTDWFAKRFADGGTTTS